MEASAGESLSATRAHQVLWVPPRQYLHRANAADGLAIWLVDDDAIAAHMCVKAARRLEARRFHEQQYRGHFIRV
jgi:hypothetical protein